MLASNIRQIVDRARRLAACGLIRSRFAGRAEMERSARRDVAALERLEERLGLIEAGEAEHLAAWRLAAELAEAVEAATRDLDRNGHLRGASVGQVLGYWARLASSGRAPSTWGVRSAPLGWSARVENLRRRRRASVVPAPMRAIDRRALAVARGAYDAAGFRCATHDHSLSVVLAASDAEVGASSYTGAAFPSEVGLPRSYARKGYRVTTSRHTIAVTAEILSPGVREANRTAPGGVLYLRADLRIVQGRGTALVTERLVSTRGGKLVWRRS